MTTSVNYQFYYDPGANQIIKQSATANPSPGWLLLTEQYAQLLSTGVESGGHIYLNTAGWPVLFQRPVKPTLRWDEEATLTPVTTVDGVANQQWLIKKLSISEKLAKLAALRAFKQHTLPFKMAIKTLSPEGEKIYKDCITDQGTVYMFTQAGLTATRNPNAEFPHWKFEKDGVIEWHTVKGSDLLEAWDEASEKIEMQFSIEAGYSTRVMQGVEVDIAEWVLLPPLAEEIPNN